MPASSEAISFCEGCPFANGVERINQTAFNQRGFVMRWPNPGFEVALIDETDPEISSHSIHAVVSSSVDSSMPQGTAREALVRVSKCSGSVDATVKRLGGLLGSKTVKACGAFPDQNPSKVNVEAQTTGWFSPLDFL